MLRDAAIVELLNAYRVCLLYRQDQDKKGEQSVVDGGCVVVEVLPKEKEATEEEKLKGFLCMCGSPALSGSVAGIRVTSRKE